MIPSLPPRSTCAYVVFVVLAVFVAGDSSADQLHDRSLEVGSAAASCGSFPLSDEASFLQVSPPLVARPSRAQAASPMEPILAWLQEQRERYVLKNFFAAISRFSRVGLFFIVVVAICFGLIVVWFLYVCMTAPSTDSKAAASHRQPMLRSSPGPRPLSRIDSTDSTTSKAASAISKKPASRRDEQTHVFAIPGLKDSPLEQYKQTTYAVRDDEGQKVLHVDVMRPPQDQDATGWQVEEYVGLWSGDGANELALCALGSDPKDPTGESWACHVYQGGTEIFGYLTMEIEDEALSHRMQKYSLLAQGDSKCILTLEGDLLARRMEVRSGHHIVTRVTPGGFKFGEPGQYYTATCTQDADVGMVVLSLLVAERSFCHFAQRRRRQ